MNIAIHDDLCLYICVTLLLEIALYIKVCYNYENFHKKAFYTNIQWEKKTRKEI